MDGVHHCYKISSQCISKTLLSVCIVCGKARCICRVDNALPMLNTDLVVNGTYPPAVEAFQQKICEADCYLFASPEYNFCYRPVMFGLIKLLVLVVLVVGGGLPQYHLCQIGVCLDFHFINKPEFSLKAFRPPAKFDSEGERQ